jgi:hypothetical protein
MRKIIFTTLAVFIIIGIVAATETTIIDSDISFNSDQSVNGSGYFATYNYAKMPGVWIGTLAQAEVVGKNCAHGSGSIDNEMQMTAESLYNSKDLSDNQSWSYDAYIWMEEDNSAVYAPKTIAIGTGYYSANPITYNSLLKEDTCIKNYFASSMMHHEIEYARGIDKDLEFLVRDIFYNYTDPIDDHFRTTNMKIEENVAEGKVNLRVLQGNATNKLAGAGYAWWYQPSHIMKDPIVDIDEDYVGDISLTQNMSLVVPERWEETYSDWLTCCFGGYQDMDAKDTKWIESEVFDCTCFNVPEEAEF